ncbi:MAG: hypothetical protein H6774_04360 [Pseudomonadales bacterium]|nr:hypothetical protein [Candidatus Woesebacteria bacterium]MCB9802292.1 hypothetical protein [Pseudomonadales bacterium]
MSKETKDGNWQRWQKRQEICTAGSWDAGECYCIYCTNEAAEKPKENQP